jgi:hypothetical protein
MSIEPGYRFNFARGGDYLDPRISFVRASTGLRFNRRGLLESVAANTPRFNYNPLTKICEGLLVEGSRTNLFLRWAEFDNASWTKTSLTVTANSTTAPDGNTVADTLAVTGSGGKIAQAVTITAGRGIAMSIYAKANATSFLWAEISDGTNAVACWFNLAAGAAGTNTAGAGTNVFSQKLVEVLPNGWVRCMLETTTTSSTAFTGSFAAASADNATPANTNSCFAWGAQFEADVGGPQSASSGIPTTTATVTRSADAPHVTLDVALYNPLEGTLAADVVLGPLPPVHTGQVLLIGGIADTFNNTIYWNRPGSGTVGGTFISGGVGITVTKTATLVTGGNLKTALAWGGTDITITANGAAPTTGTNTLIASAVRLGIGVAPWTFGVNTTALHGCVRSFIYIPDRISDADLQTITA